MSILTALLQYIASMPRPVLLIVAAAVFGTSVRWRWRLTYAIDLCLIALAIERLSIGMLAWAAALIALRHVPAFATDISRLFDVASYDGWTRRAGWLLLPGATGTDDYVPIATGTTVALAPEPILVSVPGTDTSAIPPADRDITKDAWIVAMAGARDEKGKFIFSGNRIFDAVGGHRATVMARVKEIQSAEPPAQFRQEDGGTAPASHPITS